MIVVLVLAGCHSACTCCYNDVIGCGRSDARAGGYRDDNWWWSQWS